MRLRFRIFLADNHVFERWVCVQCGCIEKLRRLNKAAVRLRQKKE